MSTRAAAGEQLSWSFGLRAPNGKYLTHEAFGAKALTTDAKLMKKKSIFFLEQDDGASYCYIRTSKNMYLAVDSDGNLVPVDSKTEEAQIEIAAQDDGRWVLKSNKYGWVIGTNPTVDHDSFTEPKPVTDDKKWVVHLAMHPQVCLKNVNRKKYVHLNGDSFTTDELIPWGDDATITLKFFDREGTYGLVSSDGRYLSNTGKLEVDPSSSTHFTISFERGQVAFRSVESGKYLTAVGPEGVLRAMKTGVGKDESFIMEDSFPQLKFTANNGQKVSIKQGIEVAAPKRGTTETTDSEIFQVEPIGDKWTIKSCQDKYWKLVDKHVHANTDVADLDDNCYFEIEWHQDKVALKAANGKYCFQQKNGYIAATHDDKDEFCYFVYEIVNRPRLVLRGEHGFLGTLPSGLLECNKSVPEIFFMEITKGHCKIKGANGKYWKIGDNGVSCTGESAESYFMTLHKDSMMCLMTADGKYFKGSQNGQFVASGTEPGKETFFEY